MEAALQVPGIKGEGDEFGARGRYGLDEGRVGTLVEDAAIEYCPVAARQEASRLGVGGEVACGEGYVRLGALAVGVLEGKLDE